MIVLQLAAIAVLKNIKIANSGAKLFFRMHNTCMYYYIIFGMTNPVEWQCAKFGIS